MIKMEKVTKHFGPRIVLNNSDFEAPKGDLIIVTGPSGNGKTTLLRIIAGLEMPDSGQVLIDGVIATTGRSIKKDPFSRSIGMVFQDFALWPHMTVEQNITYGLKSQRILKKEIQAITSVISRIFKIEEHLKHYPSRLSGGEKQRVALARAFALKPKILLLDEPMSNIDRTLKHELLVFMKEFRQKNCTTVVYVTHSQADIELLNGKVMVLENGILSNEK